jgi:hypothetical protein
VAGLTEVVGTEAKPPGSFATVAAFVNDVVGAVLCAVLHTDLYTILLAEAANEVLRLCLGLLFHLFSFLVTFLDLLISCFLLLNICSTVAHSTVVRKLAFKALVVSKFE